MRYLELSLPSPEENIALDEALLLAAEAEGPSEYLRLWESSCYAVVLGKNSAVDEDVWLDRCHADGLAVLRRATGGGTVLLGPGCLNFALVLRYDRAAALEHIQESFRYVLRRLAQSLAPTPVTQPDGSTDLTIGSHKFCGNAQRRGRSHFLHHGSILLAFDIAKTQRYLKCPRRQPVYRAGRDHQSFLINLPLSSGQITQRLLAAWNVRKRSDSWPKDLVSHLVAEKYSTAAWNFRR